MTMRVPSPMAIIGLSVHSAAIADAEAFWDLILAGRRVESLCGDLAAARFDPAFFSLSQREAAHMEPRQRLLLQGVWAAIEDTGFSPDRFRAGRTSLFVGAMAGPAPAAIAEAATDADAGFAFLGDADFMLANRLSFVLGLTGESVTIDAAHASAAVALHQAMRALRSGDCDYAIVASVNLHAGSGRETSLRRAGLVSPSGRCRPFDSAADGFAAGEGVAAIVLQPADRDDGARIRAVLRGTAVGHCGRSASIMAPDLDAQRRTILAAYRDADVSPDSVAFVEAHAPGTQRGDPVEVRALAQAFAGHPGCAVGSVKANIGHLEGAAGMAGLVKAVLMLEHGLIPPQIGVERLNPRLGLDQTPFRIPAEAEPLAGRIGVNCFGLGGVVAHMVLERAPPSAESLPVAAPLPFVLSADHPAGLEHLKNDWRRFLAGAAPDIWRDACATAATGRVARRHRFGAVVASARDMLEALDRPAQPQRSMASWSLLWSPGSDSPSRRVAEAAALMQALGQPAAIAFQREGAWPALLAAGMIDAETADRCAAGDAAGRVRLSPPRLPLFDPLSRCVIGGAVPALIEAALRDRPAATYPVDDADFRDSLAEWRLPLAAAGLAGAPWDGETGPPRLRLAVDFALFDAHAAFCRRLGLPFDGGTPLARLHAALRPKAGADEVVRLLTREPQDEWDDRAEWLDACLRAPPLADDGSVRVEGDGAPLIERLLGAWSSGVPVDWRVCFPEGSFRRVGIPRTAWLEPEAPRMPETKSNDLRRIIAEVVGCPIEDVTPEARFVETLGLDSFLNMELVQRLSGWTGRKLPATLLFQFDSVGRLASHLSREAPADTAPPRAAPRRQGAPAVAIVGFHGRFPAAADPEALWSLLCAGGEAVREIPRERWDWEAYYDAEDGRRRACSKWGCFLDGIDRFDPLFFNLTPGAAARMDPQQRLFLQVAWAAVEDAGYRKEDLPRNSGVFVGAGTDTFALRNEDAVDADSSDIANRISYAFDLHGPSMTVDTACSSSLTAIHLAARGLLAGDFDLAIAGGVDLTQHSNRFLQFSDKGMLAHGPHCHPFGDAAGGFVLGEGAAAIVLKRLDDALAAGDPIHGVILGSAINSGGRTGGYTVPDPKAQAALVRAALDQAGVSARSISYVEAHGTGTRLGDPIEISGLTQAFAKDTGDRGFCAVASVKANIGHLISAAGIAGLARVLLQLRHEAIAPAINADPPNPAIDFAATPFYLPRAGAPWRRDAGIRRAGLSSFGSGGSNAHLVIEEAPLRPALMHPARDLPQAIVLSARTPERLRAYAARLLDWLEGPGRDAALADLAHTMRIGRAAFRCRMAVVAADRTDLAGQLRGILDGRPAPMEEGEAADLVRAWREGADVDWSRLYPAEAFRRIPAPTYPFAEDVPSGPEERSIDLDGGRPLLAHHRVGGRPVLPAAAFLAMLAGQPLRAVTWSSPIEAGGQARLRQAADGASVLLAGDGSESCRAAPGTAPKLDPPAIDRDESDAEGGAALYARLRERGLDYGPAYRVLEWAKLGAGRLTARLVLPPQCPAEDRRTVWLDAAMQAAVLLDPSPAIPVPRAVASAYCLGHVAPDTGWLAARRTEDGGVDVDLADDDGRPFARLDGIAIAAKADPLNGFLRVPEWVPADDGWAAPPAGRSLVVGDDPLASELAARLRDAVLIRPGETAAGSFDAVFHLGALAPGDPFGQGVFDLLRWVRLLSERTAPGQKLRLVAVTRDVHSLGGGSLQPAGAAVHGLVKVLAKERRDWAVSCLDLSGEPGLVEAILAEPPALQGDEIMLREGRRWKRVLRRLDLPPAGQPPFRDGGHYLILGGAGGLGRVFSAHLAARHRARLSWIGSREEDDAIRDGLAAIRAMGGEARYFRAEATDQAALAAAIDAARAAWGRVDGAVHSAIRLEDRLADRMSDEAFRAAFDVKVKGADHLCRALAGDPPDFIAFFSSGMSFLGFAGQANYAAGCAFEDALARHLGLPVRSINWGYWGTTGIVADAVNEKRLARQGLLSIQPADGIEALTRLLDWPLPQIAAMRMDADLSARLDDLGTAWRGFPPSSLPAPETVRLDLPPLDFQDRARWRQAAQRFGRARLAAALARLPWPEAPWRGASDALRDRLGIAPRHHRLFAALLRILDRMGAIAFEGQSVALPTPLPILAAEDLAADHPGYAGQVRLLEICLDALPDILAGRRAATDVMFPDGSSALVEAFYRGNALADRCNDEVAAVIRQAAAAAPPQAGRPLTVLEIGAGTGSTSLGVLEALAGLGPVRYVFTDISPAFIASGRARLAARFPFAEFATLNIERDPAAQGFVPGDCDVVLATNVLHATRRIDATLANAKRLLRRNGWLVVNEIVAADEFLTLTFGLLDGWWLFEDAGNRLPDAPLMASATWRDLLAKHGFGRTAILSGAEADQQVVVAASNGLDRVAVETPRPRAMAREARPAAEAPLEERLQDLIERVLRIPRNEIDPRLPFSDYGIDSISGIELIRQVNAVFGLSLRASALFDHPSVEALAAAIRRDAAPPPPPASLPPASPASTAHRVIAEFLDVPPEAIDPRTPVWDYGVDATDARLLISRLNRALNADFSTDTLVDHPTADAMQRLLSPQSRPPSPPAGHDAIAIIGLSGRFGGADDLDAFWAGLEAGRDWVVETPRERWDVEAVYHPEGGPGRTVCRHGAFLSGIDQFDPLFFGMSGAEANITDPQQRLFLEECWRALDDAGYVPRSGASLDCGVFVGIGEGDYLAAMEEAGVALPGQTLWANAGSVVASRISYVLDLRGPAMAIDTACSSSLTAVHLACRSLLAGECRVALAGGVFVRVTPRFHVAASNAGMLSPNGRCATFDEAADGFVPGEGAGVVVLKPLAAALADNDRIHGIIRASNLNQDGRSNGVTAPSGRAQTELLLSTWERAGISPETLSYVEAHGTGTRLGDPIEVDALTNAFRRHTARTGFCTIGSVKTNIGHAAFAAGIAGLIKVLLMMRHRFIPPTLHFRRLNQHIEMDASPFVIAASGQPWRGAAPLRAGVSSFGMSGTNAHLVIEAPPAPVPPCPARPMPFRRRRCWFDAGEPEPGRQSDVIGIAAALLGLDAAAVDPEAGLLSLGLDSLSALELARRLGERFGTRVSLADVLGARNLAGLSARLGSPRSPVSEPTAGQRALWLHWQRHPRDPAYNVPSAYRLSEPVDADALERALARLNERHPQLQSRFETRPDGGLAIAGGPDARLERIVCGDVEAEMLSRAEAPFDLASGPPVRFCLLDDAVLMVVAHHAVFDGRSVAIFLAELQQLYAAERGGAAALKPAGRWDDFVKRQHAYSTGARAAGDRAWWLARLKDAVPLDLAAGRPRQGARAIGTCSVPVAASIVAGLRDLARRNGTTPASVLLAVLAALLHRMTGQTDICIGMPYDGRGPEDAATIGHFINLLAVRLDLNAGRPVSTLTEQASLRLRDALDHGDYPLGEVMGAALPPASDLFRVLLVHLDRAAEQEAAQGPLGLDRIAHIHQRNDADLTVEFYPMREDGLAVLAYDRSLFDGPAAGRILSRFLHALEIVVGGEDPIVGDLPLPPEEEATLRRLPAGPGDALPKKGVDDLFREVAARDPGALAVADGSLSLTYGELESASDRIAAGLRKLGAGPERAVAVALRRRGAEMAMVLLGILKSGSFYVPVDVALPPQRVRSILADARAEIVVADAGWEAAADGATIATPARLLQAAPEADPPRHPPERLCYMLFTSGSTGRPKAVGVDHRAVVRLVRGPDYGDIRPDDRMLQFAPLSFDASTFEIWGALANGAALTAFAGADTDFAGLTAFLAEQRISVAFLTGGLFNLMVDQSPACFAGLRRLVSGGEAMSPVHAARFVASFPGVRLLNGYGPTENTVFSTLWSVPTDLPPGAVPIGRPIAHTTAYVLDARLNPAPIGVAGDLYLGGAGLARGYTNDARGTAAAFIANPFAPGERLYRSGDRAMWDEEGDLRYLGRADRQVKLRGFRIEPGEIEAGLASLPGVRKAAVIVREPAPGERHLAAYLEGDAHPAKVKSALAEILPAYMVPSTITIVDRLPLTAVGKVDHAALTGLPARAAPSSGSDIERRVAAIWHEVVGCGAVAPDDNFFDVGGNSLAMVKVHVRLRAQFPDTPALAELFGLPTVGDIARRLSPVRPPAADGRSRMRALALLRKQNRGAT